MHGIEELIKKSCPDGVIYKRLEECCNILDNQRRPVTKSARQAGKYPYYGANGIQDYVSDYIFDGTYVLVGEDGSVTTKNGNPIVTWAEGKIWVNNHAHIIEEINGVSLRYLYYYIQTINISNLIHGNIPKLNQGDFRKLKIAVPPIEVQNRIVRILDNFTELEEELEEELKEELEARKKQYEYYRNTLLDFDDAGKPCGCTHTHTHTHTHGYFIKIYKLKDLVDFKNGKGHEKEITDSGKYIVANSKFISSNGKIRKFSDLQIVPLYIDDILIVMSDLPNGKALAKCFLVQEDNKYTLNQRIGCLHIKDSNTISTKFLYYILNRNKQLLRYDNGVDQTNLRKDDILKIDIPIPPLEKQQKIVSILDRFDKLYNDIAQGLPAEIEARRKQYEYYRDKLLNFKELKVENKE